jgi:aspartate beta-hydroxylase
MAEQAIGHFRAATAADPSAIALWMNLAKAHRLAGDDDAERAALEEALAIDQLHLMALIRLAELHERRAEIGSATDRWAMVLGLCAQIPKPTPQLDAMISHARAFVAERQLALAEAIEANLSDMLGSASERDRRRASAAAELMVGRRKIFTHH